MSSWVAIYSSPTNFLLMVFIACGALVMWQVQKRSDFDWAQIFQDEDGRVSAGRFLAIGAFLASTWVMMHTAVEKTLSDGFALGYLAAWSGTMVASKAVDAYRQKGAADVRDTEISDLRSDSGGDVAGGGGGLVVREAPPVASGNASRSTGSVGIGREKF